MFENFRLATPSLLLLYLLLPILWAVHRQRALHRRVGALRFADLRAVVWPHRSWRLIAMPLLPLLRFLGLSLMIFGIARPQSIQAREVIRGDGIQIALALDISGSMASLDFEPRNRLTAAKQVITDFVADREYDQIGLVVFAQNAYNQSPPTVDHRVLSRLLAQTELATDLGIADGTAIGMGLANAANMLRHSSARSRIVILLTDGVNNDGQIDPLTAARAAAALDIKVYAIGMGRLGQVPVPIADDLGRERIVMQNSTLDEKTLKAIAATTGGRYFRAEDTQSLRDVYREIGELEKTPIEVTTFVNYRELAAWLLAPALLLFLIELLLRETLLRRLP